MEAASEGARAKARMVGEWGEDELREPFLGDPGRSVYQAVESA